MIKVWTLRHLIMLHFLVPIDLIVCSKVLDLFIIRRHILAILANQLFKDDSSPFTMDVLNCYCCNKY